MTACRPLTSKATVFVDDTMRCDGLLRKGVRRRKVVMMMRRRAGLIMQARIATEVGVPDRDGARLRRKQSPCKSKSTILVSATTCSLTGARQVAAPALGVVGVVGVVGMGYGGSRCWKHGRETKEDPYGPRAVGMWPRALPHAASRLRRAWLVRRPNSPASRRPRSRP